MKIRPVFLALIVLSPAGQIVRAQETKDAPALSAESAQLAAEAAEGTDDAPKASVIDLLDNSAADEAKIIEALSAADQTKLRELLRDASTFVSGIRLQEAFEKLFEAEEIAPELFTIHNLKGAAYTKMRDFDKARASFDKALKIAPNAFMAQFNLAETEFVTHQYPAALQRLEPLLPMLEKQAKEAEEAAKDPKKPFNAAQRKNLQLQADATRGTMKLIQYKLLICNLKTDNEPAARKIQKSFNFMDDDPAFYYGNAALAFQKADEAKGDEKAARAAQEEAQEWLRSAEKIYARQQLEIYTDSLIETGWIDNLQ